MEQRWRWDRKRERAAVLVADDRLSDEQIAAEVAVGRTTLHRWRQHPEFVARVQELVAVAAAQMQRHAIAQRHRRVAALNDRWQRMQAIIDARATDPMVQDAPGGATGLIVHQVKMIGMGKSAQRVDEYVVDTGLLREMRETEKQAAQEVGQWTEKHEHSGEVLVRQYVGVPVDDV